jgi:hypothetical protein
MHDWARGVAQVIKCLPSKHKALNSNPSTTTTKQESMIANIFKRSNGKNKMLKENKALKTCCFVSFILLIFKNP